MNKASVEASIKAAAEFLKRAKEAQVGAAMNKAEDDYPSFKIKREIPFGCIQWKGTSVCMDIVCVCGASSHADAEFCHHIKCTGCGQVYECDPHIQLHPLAGYEGAIETEGARR